ncbi:MAG: hypothetical protein JNL08_05170 [Planctomycetes bacterium]|nr:hypothetical protein [Planctomycetota bacterium]
MPAAAAREPVPAELTIRLPAGAVEPAGAEAGIATYDASTSADFTWTPLAGAAVVDGSVAVTVRTHARGALLVALAAAPAWARHGYLVRTRIDVPADATTYAVELPVATAAVQLTLPAGATHAGPLRLVRCDDPQWLPTLHAATGLVLERDRPTTLVLGAGSYELVDPIDAARRQRFEVPAAAAVELSPTLAAARADRP